MVENYRPINTCMGQIYKITNLINSDLYVGFTTKGLLKRLSIHKRNSRDKNHNTHLSKAIRKYGEENFIIELLQDDANINVDESKWIEELQPHYNMTLGGEGGDTSKSPNHIDAVKKYNATLKPEDYATYGHLGKKHSHEAKEKQSIARAKCWQNMSSTEYEDRCNSITGSNNGMFGKVPANAIPIIIEGIRYTSMRDACEKLKIQNEYYLKKIYKIEKVNI